MQSKVRTGWFSQEGVLQPFSDAEVGILEFLLTSHGLSDVQTVRSQLQRAIVHEVDPGRYLQLFVLPPFDVLKSEWTGLYGNAFAPIGETEGVEALLHLSNGVVSALEFSYSPEIEDLRLPEPARWMHL